MSASKSRPLFPPGLNEGSVGGAVDTLHMILDAFGFGEGLVADLEYGKTTTQRVADLQRWLGVEADGQFGPTTRAALTAKTNFNVDKIEWAPQNSMTMWVNSNSEEMGAWPQAEA